MGRLSFEKIGSIDSLLDCTIVHFFDRRRDGTHGDSCSALSRFGENGVDHFLGDTTPASIVDRDKLDTVLDKLDTFDDGIEAFGATREDFHAEEFQVRAPFDIEQLLILRSNTQ